MIKKLFMFAGIAFPLLFPHTRVRADEPGNKIPKRIVSVMDSSIHMAVEDLFDATGYVITHAAEWQIDPGKIISCGSSAGAITV
ncbi:MAG: alpha/beta hydrolase, partial [Tannerella sp.]|nr:alpha/beta hydrolase [Tannerella sp.]